MEQVEVEAVEDRTQPQGGHAVILLRGTQRIPPTGAFTIRPVDTEGMPPDAQRFFHARHTALSVATTADGVAMSIGPGIADHPALVPGTAVEIVLPETGCRGEFLWPAVAPLARPKRRNIMTRRTGLEGMRPDLRSADLTSPTSLMTASAAPDFVAAQNAPADIETVSSPASRHRPSVVTSGERTPTPDDSVTDQAPGAAVEPTLARSAKVEPVVDPEIVIPIEAAAAPNLQPRPATTTWTPAARSPERPTSLEFPVNHVSPVPATSALRPAAHGWSASSAAALAVVLLIAGQLLALRALDLRVEKRLPPRVETQQTPAPARREVAAAASGENTAGIYDVLSAGEVSPRGFSASGVSPARALQLAHTLQHGPEAGRDRDEAIYWLKRYVLATTGAEHSRIALTQLGSAYATPVQGKQDLTRARVAWELAGALGDTVALCFLAALHERGIGVEADSSKAEAWYARAAAIGGSCVRSN